MVTTKEYLEALELIKTYHKEQNDVILKNKILIEDWVYRFSRFEVGARLSNVLLGDNQSGKNFKYLEDVTFDRFIKMRNAGMKSWTEFEDLIEK